MGPAGKPGDGQSRGMLKPGLSWPAGTPKPAPAPRPGIALPKAALDRLDAAAQAKKSGAQAQKKAGLGANSVTQGQYSLEQLKKMAASRGISVEKLVAQMVQQYLKEDQAE